MRALVLAAGLALTIPAAAQAGGPREVSFPTADGGIVSADLYGQDNRPAVVLAHGAVFNKESWGAFATDLAARGQQVLAIDFRGYGASKAGSAADARFEDVLAAVRYLRAHGASKVVVLGASMGGAAVAEAAARAEHGMIERVILLSPAPIADPARVPGPTLVIASKEEPAAGRIQEEYALLLQPKKLVLLPGTAHAQHILRTDQAAMLTDAVRDFLAGP